MMLFRRKRRKLPVCLTGEEKKKGGKLRKKIKKKKIEESKKYFPFSKKSHFLFFLCGKWTKWKFERGTLPLYFEIDLMRTSNWQLNIHILYCNDCALPLLSPFWNRKNRKKKLLKKKSTKTKTWKKKPIEFQHQALNLLLEIQIVECRMWKGGNKKKARY